MLHKVMGFQLIKQEIHGDRRLLYEETSRWFADDTGYSFFAFQMALRPNTTCAKFSSSRLGFFWSTHSVCISPSPLDFLPVEDISASLVHDWVVKSSEHLQGRCGCIPSSPNDLNHNMDILDKAGGPCSKLSLHQSPISLLQPIQLVILSIDREIANLRSST